MGNCALWMQISEYIEQVYNHKLLQTFFFFFFLSSLGWAILVYRPGQYSHQNNIPHYTVIGPDEWFHWLVVVLHYRQKETP